MEPEKGWSLRRDSRPQAPYRCGAPYTFNAAALNVDERGDVEGRRLVCALTCQHPKAYHPPTRSLPLPSLPLSLSPSFRPSIPPSPAVPPSLPSSTSPPFCRSLLPPSPPLRRFILAPSLPISGAFLQVGAAVERSGQDQAQTASLLFPDWTSGPKKQTQPPPPPQGTEGTGTQDEKKTGVGGPADKRTGVGGVTFVEDGLGIFFSLGSLPAKVSILRLLLVPGVPPC